MSSTQTAPPQKLPASRLPGWDEEAYKDHFDQDCIWWPWWVAREFFWRKTRTTIDDKWLMTVGTRGAFICGVRNGAPSRKAPVDRATFMNWVQGTGKGKK